MTHRRVNLIVPYCGTVRLVFYLAVATNPLHLSRSRSSVPYIWSLANQLWKEVFKSRFPLGTNETDACIYYFS